VPEPSPLFAAASYSSSGATTQSADAVQRAQFFNRAPASWHPAGAGGPRHPHPGGALRRLSLRAAEDVFALGHEVLEAFNDPFVGTDGVHNITPWWQEAVSGTRQNKNEVSDVVQGMAGAIFPLELSGRTYHLQSQALLPGSFRDKSRTPKSWTRSTAPIATPTRPC